MQKCDCEYKGHSNPKLNKTCILLKFLRCVIYHHLIFFYKIQGSNNWSISASSTIGSYHCGRLRGKSARRSFFLGPCNPSSLYKLDNKYLIIKECTQHTHMKTTHSFGTNSHHLNLDLVTG